MPLILTLAMSVGLLLSPLVLHEMGHWIVMRRYGVAVREVWLGLGPKLFSFGSFRICAFPIGAALSPDIETYTKLPPRARMHIALGGPVASLFSAVVLFAAWQAADDRVLHEGLGQLALLNLFIAALNILPIPPLDGFQAWVAYRESNGKVLSEKTKRWSQRIGTGVIYGFGFFYFANFILWP